VQAGLIAIQWLVTADMPADGLTKALSKQKHTIFIKQLYLVDISSRIEGKEEEDDSIKRYASLGVFYAVSRALSRLDLEETESGGVCQSNFLTAACYCALLPVIARFCLL
jgi:hypothetical protein